MREIQTRWGRRNLGFGWLFAEPLVFSFPVLTMWSYIRSPYEAGIPMIAFLWTGYLPLLIFRHVTALALYSVRMSSPLLYHEIITPFDIFIGRCGLEALGNLAACVVSFLVFYLIGVLDWPADLPMMLAGFLFMTWWSLAVALLVAALCERSDIVEHIWMPVSYMYMAVSGFMYLAAWLPPSIRAIGLTVMPSLPAYEMIRGGYFGSLVKTYPEPIYLVYVLSGITLLGLWFMRYVRQHLEIL